MPRQITIELPEYSAFGSNDSRLERYELQISQAIASNDHEAVYESLVGIGEILRSGHCTRYPWPFKACDLPNAKCQSLFDNINKHMFNLRKRVQFDRYPAFSHEAYHFDEFLKTYLDFKPTKRIQATSRIVTFGSCFADNFARYLQERGVHAFNAWIGENFNSPLTNFRMLTSRYRFDELTGKYCLADESQRIISKALDEQKSFYHLFGQMRESLKRADFLVMTVGNSLCARDSEGRIYPYLEGYIAGVKHELMQIEQVIQYLHGTIEEVLNINPNIHIIITLSPIAIHGALGMNPVLADCISKSNNRVAIHRLLEIFDPIRLTYFPSFEIIRWLAPLSCSLRWSGPTHPSDDMLDSVMKLFFSAYTDVAF